MYKFNPKTGKWEEEIKESDKTPIQNNNIANQQLQKKTKKKSFLDNTFDFLGSFVDKGAIEDGLNFGNVAKTIVGTVGKGASSFVKGIWGIGEGIGDLITYGEANLLEKTGLFKNSINPDDLRAEAQVNQAEKIWRTPDAFEKWSATTSRSDGLIQSVGYMYGLQAIGGVTKALGGTDKVVNATITGTTFSTAMGNGMTEAYENGATNGEAFRYGIVSGIAEAGSEMIFGGIGKGTNALGLSRGIGGFDDQLASAVSSRFKSRLMKNLSQYLVKASGEGVEEVVSGFFQGLGKKLTYMSDKDLSEILRDEKLFDQFVDGAISAGISSAPSLVKSTVKGADYVTGFTSNEDKVVDSLVESKRKEAMKQHTIDDLVDRNIKEAQEALGTELSEKEKNSIKEKVIKKIEEGEIDTYSSNLSNKEISKIKKEVVEQLQNGEVDYKDIEKALASKEVAKIDVLKEKLNNTSNKNERRNIEAKINELTLSKAEIMKSSLENDSFLQKSYYEENQKAVKYQFDKKSINNDNELFTKKTAAKYMNNTTKSRKIVDIVSKISNDTGVQYGFTNSEDLKKLGHEVKDREIDGFVRTNKNGKTTILLNVDSNKSLNVILGHETTHLFENVAESEDFRDLLFKYATEKGELKSKRAAVENLYEDIKDVNIDNEVAADLVGDYLFTDEKFIETLSKKQTLFTKIKNLIDDLVIKFTGTDEEKQLREIQKKFSDIYQNSDIFKQEKGIKYHISKNAMNDVESVLNDITIRNPVKLRDYTPSILVQNGIEDLPMYENPSHIRKNVLTDTEAKKLGLVVSKKDHYHGLGKETYIRAIDSLDNPRVIFKRNNNNEFLILTTIKDGNNNNIIVPIEIETTTYVNNLKIDINRVKTVFGYDRLNPDLNKYIKDNINANKFIKIYEQKMNPSTNITSQLGSTENNISQSNNNVKSNTLSNNSNMQNNTKYSLSNKELDNSSFNFDENIKKYVLNEDFYKQFEYEDDSIIKESIKEINEQIDALPNNYLDMSEEQKDLSIVLNYKKEALKAGFDNVKDYLVDKFEKNEIDKYKKNPDLLNKLVEKKQIEEKKKAQLQEDISSSSEFKNAQFNVVQKYNPMFDDEHVGIRSPKDIKTFEEAILDEESFSWGDYSKDDAKRDLKRNKVMIYSSYPIKQGVFVSTSRIQAEEYAGGPGNYVYSKLVKPERVAWINGDEGQYASVKNKFTNDAKFSLSNNNNDIAPVGEFNIYGKDVKYTGRKSMIDELLAPLPKSFVNQSTGKEYTNDYSPLEKDEKKTVDEKIKKAAIKEQLKRAIQNGTFKGINSATKAAKDYMDFSYQEKKSFREDMRQFMGRTRETLTSSDTYNKIKEIVSKYANRDYNFIDEEVKEIKKEVRKYEIKVDDDLKKQLVDYNYFKKANFGKLKLSNKGQSIDSIWQELCEDYPHMFNKNITSQADQLYALSDFMNQEDSMTHSYRLSDADIDEVTSRVFNKLKDNALNNYDIGELENQLEERAYKRTREVIRNEMLDEMEITIDDLNAGNDISAINYSRTDPVRVIEKVFGPKIGKKINDALIYRTKHNEAESIRWQNAERKEIADLGIKARSKESAAVQKYGEKRYVNDYGEYVKYGDKELAAEFSDPSTQEKIKKAASVIRSKYDAYIDNINEVLVDMGYDAIPKRNDYMRHFYELNDKLSHFGVPFSQQNLNDDLLPTDINGITEDFKPGKSWFASSMERKGIKTTYDAITGIDGYISSASNVIFHTEDIQRYRALSKMIRDTFGEKHGLDNAYELSESELDNRIEDIKNHKLSRFVVWLDEQANALAGKKGSIDRGIEKTLGRRVYNFANALKSQVGANMTGFNARSALTNFASTVQAFPKIKKLAFIKGTIDSIKQMVVQDDLRSKSDFLTARDGTNMLSQKMWQKMSNAGQFFMTGTDRFTSNVIWRSKYYELLSEGYSENAAIKQADDFAARIMGDRTKGATANIFNSKTLGLFTQFQLEVNNQWDAMIHDNKMDVKNGTKTANAVIFQLGQLAAASWLFNRLFEGLAGSSVLLDPIEMLKKLFCPDEDDEDKDLSTRSQEVIDEFLDNVPFASILTGGRIPISEALPVSEFISGKDQYGNEKSRVDILLEALPYYVMPTGYNQLNKTTKGLKMFDKDLPVTGSYTDSGKLRFPVEDTPFNRTQAALFGQYASKNARKYFDQGRSTLTAKEVEEYKNLGLPIEDYWNYRDDLKSARKTTDENGFEKYTDSSNNTYWFDKSTSTIYDQDYNIVNVPITSLNKVSTTSQAFDFITNLDVSDKQKEIMFNNVVNKSNTDQYGFVKYTNKELNKKGKLVDKTYYYDENNKILYDSDYNVVDSSKLLKMTKVDDKVSLKDYNKFSTYEEFDFYSNNKDKYNFLKANDVDFSEYTKDKDTKSAYDWAYKNPEKYMVSKLITNDVANYKTISNNLNNIKGNKNAKGETISGSRKAKVINYINSLDLDYMPKIFLYKMEYPSDDTYNAVIVNYLNSRSDLSFPDIKTILEELDMKVYNDGTVRW